MRRLREKDERERRERRERVAPFPDEPEFHRARIHGRYELIIDA